MRPENILEDHENRLRYLETATSKLAGGIALIVFEIPVAVAVAALVVALIVKRG